jgi:hypothetical protein
MKSLEKRPPPLVQTKDAWSHALVVVDDVELVASRVKEFLQA